MELESCLTIVALFAVLVASGVVSEGNIPVDGSLQTKLIERMDNIQLQLREVTRSMGSLDSDIGKMLFQCLDKSDSSCKNLNVVDGRLAKGGWSSLRNLNKSSASEIPLMARNRRLFTDLFRKRAMVNHLMGVVKGADNVLKSERKRTCQLNLGFHCETEEISDFADIYDFLSSEKSPGKKRQVRSALTDHQERRM